MQVPPGQMADFLKFNQDMAAGSTLLPQQSAKMAYAALTKCALRTADAPAPPGMFAARD